MNINQKKDFLINLLFYTACIFVICFSFKFMTAYLLPFLIGLITAYSVQKPAFYISGKLKIKKQLCAAVLSVMLYFIIVLLLFLIFWFVFSKINVIIEYVLKQIGTFKSYTEKINGFTDKFSHTFDKDTVSALEKVFEDAVTNTGTKITDFISKTATLLIKRIPAIFVSVIVTVVATCYISKDYDKLKKFLKGFVKEKTYNTAVEIKNIFTDCILKFIFGYFLIMLITFVELLIGFFALGVDNYVLTAAAVSLIDILPVLGTGTVLLPWSFLLFLQGDVKLAVGMIVLYIVISVIRNFTEPKIIGKQIGINPLFTLLFMFLGLKLAGLTGMIFLPISLIVGYTFYKKELNIA